MDIQNEKRPACQPGVSQNTFLGESNNQSITDRATIKADRVIPNFRQAMIDAGMQGVPDEIYADGEIHRFATSGKASDSAGYYVLHIDDLPAGLFGCWRSGIKHKWCAKKPQDFSPKERAAHAGKLRHMKAQREKEKQEEYERKSRVAESDWKAACPATEHDYLTRKQIQPHGLRVNTLGQLVMPLRDTNGKLWSLQRINPDGSKKNYGRKKGLYYAIDGDLDILAVTEGFATGASVREATGFSVAVAVDAGNLNPVAEALREKFPDKKIVICGDDDNLVEGNPGKTNATEAAQAIGGYVVVPQFKSRESKPTDLNDLAHLEGLDEVCRQVKYCIKSSEPQTEKLVFVGLDLRELLEYKFQPKVYDMLPWLPRQGLSMIYGPRGIAKTQVALNLGIAIASGGTFLGWQAPDSRRVLYLDGEMAGASMQERAAAIVAGLGDDGLPDPSNFILITPDVQDRAMLDLSDPGDQLLVKPYTDQADVIIADNISTLCRSGVENKAEDWMPVQDWMLRMRREGRTVVLIHHGGKGGSQRGTSKREDILNSVINLRYGPEYSPESGVDIEVHFEKARDFSGPDAAPLHVKMKTAPNEDGIPTQSWLHEALEVKTSVRVVELSNEGLTPKEIAFELEVNKSTVSRHLKKAKKDGLIQGRDAA